MERLIDIFEPEISFTIEEATGEVDGKHVLAKVRGPFFVPEGISRNKRYYSRSLWEKAIEKVKPKLKNRTLFGTIGHEQELTDTALLEGKVSHIVTDLYIDSQGRGIGEALILNTPAGRVLNTLLRAGSKLYVSSRAEGRYSGTKNGVSVVDEDSYELKGFDFVIDPGFFEAQPTLVESLEKDLNYCFPGLCKKQSEEEKEEEGGASMDTALLEAKVKENLKLQEDLEKALGEVEELKKKVSVLEAKNEELAKKAEEKDKLEERMKELEEKLNAYAPIGTPEEIDEALTKAKEVLEAYRDLGTPEEIEEAFDKVESLIRRYSELGTPEEIDEALTKAKEVLEAYSELGTPEEIEEVFDRVEALVSETLEEVKEKRIAELAGELGVPKEMVAKVYDKMDEDEIREFFKEFSEQVKIKSKYEKKVDTGDSGDSAGAKPIFESRGERLLHYFTK